MADEGGVWLRLSQSTTRTIASRTKPAARTIKIFRKRPSTSLRNTIDFPMVRNRTLHSWQRWVPKPKRDRIRSRVPLWCERRTRSELHFGQTLAIEETPSNGCRIGAHGLHIILLAESESWVAAWPRGMMNMVVRNISQAKDELSALIAEVLKGNRQSSVRQCRHFVGDLVEAQPG